MARHSSRTSVGFLHQKKGKSFSASPICSASQGGWRCLLLLLLLLVHAAVEKTHGSSPVRPHLLALNPLLPFKRAIMGISKVIGIAGTSLLVTSVGLWKIGLRIVAVPFLATSTIAYIIAVASHNSINIPWMLGKNSKGRFPIWSSVLFGPFLILARVYATMKRHMRKKEAVYNMITEGVYLGGWPFMLKHLPPGDPSVIDCTCELPRSDFVPTNEYLCVPTWDTRAPTISQIEFAARWACEKRAKGKPVYVHCAFVLVALGIAENWKDAENIIREKRKIKMNAVHRKTLDDWNLGDGFFHQWFDEGVVRWWWGWRRRWRSTVQRCRHHGLLPDKGVFLFVVDMDPNAEEDEQLVQDNHKWQFVRDYPRRRERHIFSSSYPPAVG
uniref:Uncharacterized protein n=1 Tax=Oryza nivara TaxID=4536 RepID=A0A0E0JAM0_ORYNI